MQSTVQLCLSLCTFLLTNISNKFLTNGGLCVLLVKSSWIFFFFFWVKTWLLSFKKNFFSLVFGCDQFTSISRTFALYMSNCMIWMFCICHVSNPKYLVTTCTFVGFESSIPRWVNIWFLYQSTVICQTAGQQSRKYSLGALRRG